MDKALDNTQMNAFEQLSFDMFKEVLEKVFKDEGFNAVMQVSLLLGNAYEKSVELCEQQGWDTVTVRGVAATHLGQNALGKLHQELVGL